MSLFKKKQKKSRLIYIFVNFKMIYTLASFWVQEKSTLISLKYIANIDHNFIIPKKNLKINIYFIQIKLQNSG